MTGWSLAVDFGTTYTTAAMVTEEAVTLLELEGSTKIPSAVALGDDGELVVGLAPGDEAGWSPDRIERNPKRSLGRTKHLVLGGTPVSVTDAVAALLRAVADEGRRRRNGEDPDALVLAHPVRWSESRCAALTAAAAAAGLPEPRLVAEPVAAALHYLDARISPGDLVAVYDLGGGTFDTAVLRRTGDGFEQAGEPGGNADLGGERLDDLLFGMIGARLAQSHPDLWARLSEAATPGAARQAAELRRDVRRAKEALSRQQAFTVHVGEVELRITRPEYEALVSGPLRDTVDELAATIERCDVRPQDIGAIFLVGGASRTPLVSRLVDERFGALPATFDDPKSVVVLGAAGLARTAAPVTTAPGGTDTGTAAGPAPVYDLRPPVPSTPPIGTPAPAAPRGRAMRWLMPVAAAAVVAGVVAGGVAIVGPRLVSSTAPLTVPAAPAPAAAVVLPAPPPVTTTPAASAAPATTRARATTTTQKPKPTSTTTTKTTQTCSPGMEDPMTGSMCGEDTSGQNSDTSYGTSTDTGYGNNGYASGY